MRQLRSNARLQLSRAVGHLLFRGTSDTTLLSMAVGL